VFQQLNITQRHRSSH